MTESGGLGVILHRSATVADTTASAAVPILIQAMERYGHLHLAPKFTLAYWRERRYDRRDAARCQRTPQIRSDASQITINASRVASLYKRRAGRGPNRRLACPARSRRIACLRCKPLTAANSSRIRPRSFRLPEAYRPASAATSSSRVVMLIHPISAPADDARWGAIQMRQRVSPREHLRRGNAAMAAPAG